MVALPIAYLPSGITDVLSVVTNSLHYADLILPMSDLILVAKFGMAVELAIITFKAGEFIYNKLRGSG